MNNKVVFNTINKKSQLFNHYIFNSVVMFEEALPLFQWIAKASDKFDSFNNKINAAALPGAESVATLEELTIRTKVYLEAGTKGKGKTIVGHSSCGCWVLALQPHGELTFGTRCESSIV